MLNVLWLEVQVRVRVVKLFIFRHVETHVRNRTTQMRFLSLNWLLRVIELFTSILKALNERISIVFRV